MNGSEANTAFAVIANWRGASLSDDERAAWKHQLWRMEWDDFDVAIEKWSQGPKKHMRPSIGDLWGSIPRPAPAAREYFVPGTTWDAASPEFASAYADKIRAEVPGLGTAPELVKR